jgi:hypothetical protein
MNSSRENLVEELLSESEPMQGALGAIAYVALKALEMGGANTKLVMSTRLVLDEHFQNLNDEQCNALCDMLYARLRHEAEETKAWYGEG